MNCDRCEQPIVGDVLLESSCDDGNSWNGCEPAEQHVARPGNVGYPHRHVSCPVTALSLVGKRYKSDAGDSFMVTGILPKQPCMVQVQNLSLFAVGGQPHQTVSGHVEDVARAIEKRPDTGPLPWEKRRYEVRVSPLSPHSAPPNFYEVQGTDVKEALMHAVLKAAGEA